MNRAAFYAALRTPAGLFKGKLTQEQVRGMEAILDACQAAGYTDQRWIAYALATAYHETGQAMAPVTENLNYSADGLRRTFPKYFSPADATAYARQPERIANRAYGNRMGNGPEASGDGWRFRGRGFCQITGRDNYSKFAKLLGLDLVKDPDLALRPDIAAKIMAHGMKAGTFTGKKLADYFNENDRSIGARAIINGTDRAGDIAGYAQTFRSALAGAK